MQHVEHIGCAFLLGTQRWVLYDHAFVVMDVTAMVDERKPTTGQPILLGNDQGADCTSNTALHHGKKRLALNMQTAATFFHPPINHKPASDAEWLKVLPLIHHI